MLSWGSDSEVCFELMAEDEKVLMVVTHRRLPDRGEMLSVATGWHTHLKILVALLNGTETPSFWNTHTQLEAEYESRIPASNYSTEDAQG